MFLLYSVVYTFGFIIWLPRIVIDALYGGKHAAGFFQKLGFVPKTGSRGDKVIWLHCVSVGEVNAARPLIVKLISEYPAEKIVVSTTTRSGQKLARSLFKNDAQLVFYFPFDWKFTIRRTLKKIDPAMVLLMETEIWFNFLRESHKYGARVAIVNGRISDRSYRRYGIIKGFLKRVLSYPDLALMQSAADSKRIMGLGMRGNKVRVTGNLKFDHTANEAESALTDEFRDRFGISPEAPLIVAASTHEPEEKWILEAFRGVWSNSDRVLPRLMIAPRHPERFEAVAEEIRKSGFVWVRRSERSSPRDRSAEVILLNSIGELRAAYPLAEIVFVGGSLIPHGGQSVLEPAEAGKAMITGPYTSNFTAAVTEFLEKEALVQLPNCRRKAVAGQLSAELTRLLANGHERRRMGEAAAAVMSKNRGAAAKTVEMLRPLLAGIETR